jgi:peroxiredoxin family protein
LDKFPAILSTVLNNHPVWLYRSSGKTEALEGLFDSGGGIMSTVLICRDALEDAVLGNIALARAMVQRGDEVALVFTGEALAALDKGTFRWSPNFKTRDARSAVIAAAEAYGLPLAHGDLDSRWSDVRALVRAMADEKNLRLVACPLWARFLDLDPELDYLDRIDEEQLIELMKKADTIVGGY